MEKNANGTPENSPDQRHGGDSTPVASPPAGNQHNNTPTVIELSSSSDTPPVAAPESAADDAGRQAADASEMEVGTSSEADQGKKRARGDVNPGGEQIKVAKKKGELTDIPKGEPRCATCNKVFKSWKALFGHLRSHPERSYRGALPPPTAAELNMKQRDDDDHHQRSQLQQEIEQQLASTLLSVAQVVSSRLSAGRETAAPSNRGLDIDLNQPTAEEGSSSNKGGLDFDLNVAPPPESDEED